MGKIEKIKLLEELKNKIIEDDPTPELSKNSKQIVFGEGDVDADVMIIGEAPGKNEDERGEPFVGAAGKFLDDMLKDSDLNRRDVYITNIVKYRPQKNRDPSEKEKMIFWEYLVRQIEIIDPRVILTLGRHSGGAFLSDFKISRDHGECKNIKINKKDVLLIPLYHPAAALYNGSLREVLMSDFRNACKICAEYNSK